jgi:hypothetical protein
VKQQDKEGSQEVQRKEKVGPLKDPFQGRLTGLTGVDSVVIVKAAVKWKGDEVKQIN